jgi:hypothetical protein
VCFFFFKRESLYLVSPSSFLLNINNHHQKDQSIYWFDDQESLSIFCEIYSYPKSILEFSLNNQLMPSAESIDCFNDDRSTILLSNSLCLAQTNWRVRAHITTTISLSTNQNFTCAVKHFPYGTSWKHSINIQLLEKKGRRNIIMIENILLDFFSSSKN